MRLVAPLRKEFRALFFGKRGKVHDKGGVLHAQLFKLARHALSELLRRRAAQSGYFLRVFIELVFKLNDLFLQDLRLGRGIVELISLFFELFAFAQDLLNARAVFSLQGIYLGDALFDVARLPLVELGSAQNAAHFRRDVVQFYAHRVEAFDERAECGFVVAHARKLLHRR